MKVEGCSFCNPKNVAWEEDGFYGNQCPGCTGNKSAFIISTEHKTVLSPEERETMKKLVEKYYPGFKTRGLCDGRRNLFHWYDLLIKVEE